MSPILTTDVSLASALVLLAGLTVVSFVSLKGWRDWISLKRDELVHAHPGGHAGGSDAGVPSAASRIELADLRERLRKLEAIAAGVDL